MEVIKHDYYIITKDGIQLCLGYLFSYQGILFGVDQRGKNRWVITDIKTGLRVKEVGLRKHCQFAISDLEIELIKNLHKEQYIKYGNKYFIAGNQELLDHFLEVE